MDEKVNLEVNLGASDSLDDHIQDILIFALDEWHDIRPLDFETKAPNPFEELLGMGELVDRLTIVNLKLFHLKDEVAKRNEDKEFCAWQAVEDVRLVEERARLKKCIDAKFIAMFTRVKNGDNTAGINPETKRYGEQPK